MFWCDAPEKLAMNRVFGNIYFVGGTTMDRIKQLFSSIDRRIDQRFGFAKGFMKKYFPLISGLFVVFLIAIFSIRVFYSRPRIVASLIEDDISQIMLALEKIDVDCNILHLEDIYNEVNFLTVKQFKGSQVGPLSLAYPERWKGPYLSVNPTLRGQSYEIVKARDGLFVVPGQGVLLPNGFIIGKDFEITVQTQIADLIRSGGPLAYEGRVFAKKLLFKIGDWDPWLIRKDTIKRLDRMLEEFNDAMPYARNESNESFA